MNPVFLRSVGWDDWTVFAMRYLPLLLTQFCILALLLTLLTMVYVLFNPKKKSIRYLFGGATLAILGAWSVYFIFTARQQLMLALLGSEDDILAEAVYQTFSRNVSRDVLVDIIKDKHEDENVRFYSACALAERIGTNVTKGSPFFQAVRDAPDLRPRFFNLNGVNGIVFPSTSSISTADAIIKRLKAKGIQNRMGIRETNQPAKAVY